MMILYLLLEVSLTILCCSCPRQRWRWVALQAAREGFPERWRACSSWLLPSIVSTADRG